MKMNTKLTVLLVSLASLAGSSMATTIFTDDFSDGNRDGWFRYAENEDSSLAVVGETLELNSANTDDTVTNNFAAVRPFAAVNMTNFGTKVTLQLDFLTLENHALNRGIAIGLYDSKGTAITNDTSSGTVGDDDSGYFTYIRRNPFFHRLFENNDKGILETVTSLGNRANDDTDGLRVGGVAGTGAHVGGVTNNPGIWYTYRLEIEAIEGAGGPLDEVDHLVTVTLLEGATTLSTMTYTDTATLVGSIDQVGVISMAGNDFAIDHVSVTVDLPPNVIYSATFATSNNANLSAFGWSAYQNNGTDRSFSTVDPILVNTAGRVFIGSGTAFRAGEQYAMISDAPGINPSLYENDLTISWVQSGNNRDIVDVMGWRVLAEVGGAWYASEFQQLVTNLTTLSVVVSDATWQAWSTPETDLTDGFSADFNPAAVLPGGMITRWGLMAIDSNSTENDSLYFVKFEIVGTASAVFSITGITVTQEVINVQWEAANGIPFQPQYTTNLSVPNWQNVSGVVTATSESASATDTGAAVDNNRHYRVLRVD